MIPPINFKKWIDDNRHLLKPPIGNQVVYQDTEFIIMVVGGPNSRKDFHYNEGEEFFYQLEGDMNLRVMENGTPRDIPIREGEIFLLPPKVAHSPQRGANTIGLVVERQRTEIEQDKCLWYCENCNTKLYEKPFHLEDIVEQLPLIAQEFYKDEQLKTCSNCGHVMQPPS